MAHVDLPKQNKACGLVLHCESNAFMKGVRPQTAEV